MSGRMKGTGQVADSVVWGSCPRPRPGKVGRKIKLQEQLQARSWALSSCIRRAYLGRGSSANLEASPLCRRQPLFNHSVKRASAGCLCLSRSRSQSLSLSLCSSTSGSPRRNPSRRTWAMGGAAKIQDRSDTGSAAPPFRPWMDTMDCCLSSRACSGPSGPAHWLLLSANQNRSRPDAKTPLLQQRRLLESCMTS